MLLCKNLTQVFDYVLPSDKPIIMIGSRKIFPSGASRQLEKSDSKLQPPSFNSGSQHLLLVPISDYYNSITSGKHPLSVPNF